MITTAFIAVIMPSCKKKDADTTTNTSNAPTTSVLCDGNGTTIYFPLKTADSWQYTEAGSSTGSYSYTVHGTAALGTNTYFVIPSTLNDTLYLRQALNGDIMIYNKAVDSEYLYVPAAPVSGKSWHYTLNGANSRKIINTSASITTASCSYTNCLEIQTLDYTGNPIFTYYFQMGIGMISSIEEAPLYIVSNLSSVSLH